jgi:hypothetical protein
LFESSRTPFLKQGVFFADTPDDQITAQDKYKPNKGLVQPRGRRHAYIPCNPQSPEHIGINYVRGGEQGARIPRKKIEHAEIGIENFPNLQDQKQNYNRH